MKDVTHTQYRAITHTVVVDKHTRRLNRARYSQVAIQHTTGGRDLPGYQHQRLDRDVKIT